MGSRRIEGTRQVLNIAPAKLRTSCPASLRMPGESLEPSCASGSLERGKTQESSQKEDLFSAENIVMVQCNHFVKCQTGPLGAFIITSVGSLVKNKHTK